MAPISWKSIANLEKQYRLDEKFKYYGITDFKIINRDNEQFENLDAIYSKKKKKLYLEGTIVHPTDKSKNKKHVIFDALSGFSYDHGTGPDFYGIWIETPDDEWIMLKSPAKEYYLTFEEDYKKGWIFILFILLINQKPNSEMSLEDYWGNLREKRISPEDVIKYYSFLVEKLQQVVPKSYNEFALFKFVTDFVNNSKKKTVSSNQEDEDENMIDDEEVQEEVDEEEEEEVVEDAQDSEQEDANESIIYCKYCNANVIESTCMLTLECLSCETCICYKCCRESHYNFDYLWDNGWKCFNCMQKEHSDLDETKYNMKMKAAHVTSVYRAQIPLLKPVSPPASPTRSTVKQRQTISISEEPLQQQKQKSTEKIRKPRKKKVTSTAPAQEDPNAVANFRSKQLEHLQSTIQESSILKQFSGFAEQIENQVFRVLSSNPKAYVDRIRNVIALLKQQEIQEKIQQKKLTPNDLATKDLSELKTEQLLKQVQPLIAEAEGYETTLHPCKKCGCKRTLCQQVGINRFKYTCKDCETSWFD